MNITPFLHKGEILKLAHTILANPYYTFNITPFLTKFSYIKVSLFKQPYFPVRLPCYDLFWKTELTGGLYSYGSEIIMVSLW